MSSDKSTILVVDDEKNILRSLSTALKIEGYAVLTAQEGEEALRLIEEKPIDLVMLDVWMPEMDGLEALKRIMKIRPDLVVIMMSGQATIEAAVKATKLGAYDFIEKPISIEKISLTIENTLKFKRLERENLTLRQAVGQKYVMIGESPEMRRLFAQIKQVAPTHSRVLISGENGTGKELVAWAIYQNSTRRDKPFVKVNCAAIPEDLIESELFGHEKGAFTGATQMRHGKFELGDGGTIFLDEVGDMSLKTQAKVLRVLESGEFERVGGSKPITVDVRVITATNKDLKEEIRQGNFRQDLYYRLNVIPIFVHPLREKREDIPLLIEHFLHEFCEEYGKRRKRMTPEAIQILRRHDWPGNIRELKNIVERIVIMVPGDEIDVEDVRPLFMEPVDIGTYDDALSLKDAVNEFERDYILRKLEDNDWNVSQTAEILKIERSHLYKKMRSYGIKKPQYA